MNPTAQLVMAWMFGSVFVVMLLIDLCAVVFGYLDRDFELSDKANTVIFYSLVHILVGILFASLALSLPYKKFTLDGYVCRELDNNALYCLKDEVNAVSGQ